MSWLQATLVRTVVRGCRSFTTSAPSRPTGTSSAVAGNLLTRRRTYQNAALFWGSALAIAASVTLTSTVHADAAAPTPPAEETRGDS